MITTPFTCEEQALVTYKEQLLLELHHGTEPAAVPDMCEPPEYAGKSGAFQRIMCRYPDFGPVRVFWFP